MILSLDSSTLIDLIRGRSKAVRDRYRVAVQDRQEFAVSVMVMHELVSGIVTSRDPRVERERMEETLVGLPVIDLTAEDVEATGLVAGHLKRRGRPIGDLDILIAGQALARGWTVVTRNVRHFGRVEGLPLIDWSVGGEPLSPEARAARVAEDADR